MTSNPTPRKRPSLPTGGARGSRTPGSPASYAEIYRRVRAEGIVSRNFPISMRILQADDIVESRVGFVLRKRTGPAPLRNAMRRVLREVFRLRAPAFARPAWIVFDVSDKAAAGPNPATRAAFRAKAEALIAPLTTPLPKGAA